MRLLILFFITLSFGQNKALFYFDFNKSTFNSTQEVAFQNWINENPSIQIVKMEGFCDAIGTNNYNKKLALRRIQFVLSKCKQMNIAVESTSINPVGEDFKQDSIQDLNRKVVVYFNPKNQNLDKFLATNASGKSIVLKNLNFYNNSGEIVPASKPILQELVAAMQKYPKLKIDIQGHICCQSIEDAEKIEDIAQVRALAIYNFLIKNGIKADRLSYQSFKSSKPLFPIPEKNEDEQNANRRVEIMIIEN